MNEKKYPMAKLALPGRAIYVKYSGSIKDVHVEPHDHSVLEIALIIRGACTHHFEGKSHILIPGDCYVIYPGQIHSIDPGVDCNWYDILILSENDLPEQREIFALPAVQRLLYEKNPSFGYPLYHIPLPEREELFQLILQIIEEQRKQTENTQLRLKAYFYLLMTRLSDVVKLPDGQLSLRRNVTTEILDYMEHHFDQPVRIGTLAARAGLSESQLRRVFKEQMGLSPLEYLNHLRMQKAELMLKSGKYTVAEAAERVGIMDTAYFSRLYKQLVGRAPSKDKQKV